MAFDLYIELAGLCLLVRKQTEILVLMPKTTGGHPHDAVLGSKAKYQPSLAPEGTDPESCIHHKLGQSDVRFNIAPADLPLKVDLTGFDIADVSACKDTITPGNALVQAHLAHGEPCTTCEPSMGALWKWGGNDCVKLATMLPWIVVDVESKVGNESGLAVTITPQGGTPHDVIFRPVDGEIRLYLYHTLTDELPCNEIMETEQVGVGKPAPHFPLFYPLLGPQHGCTAPLFCKFEEDKVLASFFGRRYSCVMLTTTG